MTRSLRTSRHFHILNRILIGMSLPLLLELVLVLLVLLVLLMIVMLLHLVRITLSPRLLLWLILLLLLLLLPPSMIVMPVRVILRRSLLFADPWLFFGVIILVMRGWWCTPAEWLLLLPLLL